MASDNPPPPEDEPHSSGPQVWLRRGWAKFRSWPLWVQILVGFLALSVVVGPFVEEDEPDAETTAAEDTTTERQTTSSERSTTTERETTTTEEPTTTEAPTTTTTEPPAETIAQAVDDALGDSNRDVDRLAPITLVDGHVSIRWAINDNLTEGLIKDGARIDAVEILQALHDTGIAYATVTLEGTFPLVDQLGNSSEERVVLVTYPAELVDQINFEGFDFKNAFEITDDVFVHPAFQY